MVGLSMLLFNEMLLKNTPVSKGHCPPELTAAPLFSLFDTESVHQKIASFFGVRQTTKDKGFEISLL